MSQEAVTAHFDLRSECGLSLLELSIATAVFLTLLAILSPTYLKAPERTSDLAIRSAAATYANAINQFRQDHNGKRPNYVTETPLPGCPAGIICDWMDVTPGTSLMVNGEWGPSDLKGDPYIKQLPEMVESGKIKIETRPGKNTVGATISPPSAIWWALNDPNLIGYIQYVPHTDVATNDKSQWTLLVSTKKKGRLCWMGTDPNTIGILGWTGIDAC